jgi:hypothetical protein
VWNTFLDSCDRCPSNRPFEKVNQDIEKQVCADILDRQDKGIAKYGTTVAKNPLELRQWLQHQYEELLDAAVYCRRAIQEIDNA